MKRYINNKKLRKNKDKGFLHYSTNWYPKIERHESDIYIRTRQDERLDLLANEYYGDVTLWWVIASANNIGKAGLVVPSGIQIRIPMQLEKILGDYENFQRER